MRLIASDSAGVNHYLNCLDNLSNYFVPLPRAFSFQGVEQKVNDMNSPESPGTALVMAGIPASNNALFHRVRFAVGDPAAWLQISGDPPQDAPTRSIFILRDIEMGRARRHVTVDEVACPADFQPPDGLSGDRETATAQAVAECLRRNGIRRAIADRTLPLIFAEMIRRVGIEVRCDTEMGIRERRSKDEQEVEWLREAQRVTEKTVEMACALVAGAVAKSGGDLEHDGAPLTSERLREIVDISLLKTGYTNPTSIIAGGPTGADCHDVGAGQLYAGQPVIIDIFPCNRATRYYGDCTRTVVHGDVPEPIERMHAAVVAAKAAATAVCRAGATGEAVHEAAARVVCAHGYEMGLPPTDAGDDYCAMTHGTGHGIGLDVHEPPLLDKKGPALVVGDALTIEPGLYSRSCGGVRVEDMVIVEDDGCQNLNTIHEGLDWT